MHVGTFNPSALFRWQNIDCRQLHVIDGYYICLVPTACTRGLASNRITAIKCESFRYKQVQTHNEYVTPLRFPGQTSPLFVSSWFVIYLFSPYNVAASVDFAHPLTYLLRSRGVYWGIWQYWLISSGRLAEGGTTRTLFGRHSETG